MGRWVVRLISFGAAAGLLWLALRNPGRAGASPAYAAGALAISGLLIDLVNHRFARLAGGILLLLSAGSIVASHQSLLSVALSFPAAGLLALSLFVEHSLGRLLLVLPTIPLAAGAMVFCVDERLASNPLAERVARWRRLVVPVPGVIQEGPSSFTVSSSWYRRSTSAQLWRPDFDAQLTFTSLAIPGLTGLGPTALADEMSALAPGLTVGPAEPLHREAFDLALAARTSNEGRKGVMALFGLGDRAHLILCDGPAHRVDSVLPECERIVESFQTQRLMRPGPSAELVAQGTRDSAFIVTKEGSGSGWVMHTTRTTSFIVTNAHVVEGTDDLEVVTTRDGRRTLHTIPRNAIRVSRREDLAVFPIEADAPEVSRVRAPTAIPPGTPVFAFGFPYGFELGWGRSPDTSVHSGWMGTYSQDASDGGTSADGGSPNRRTPPQHYMQADLGVNPGNSGGPVFTQSGEFVGLVTLKTTTSETGWLISSKRVLEELELMLPGVGLPTAVSSPTLEPMPPEPVPTFDPGQLSAGIVQLRVDGNTYDGVAVAESTTDILIATQLPPGVTAATVLQRGQPRTAPGQVIRTAGLTLVVASKASLPGVRAIKPHSPSSLSHEEVLQHLRWVDKRGALEARAGRMTSRTRSDDDEQDLFAADFGLNVDERSGPIVNADGELVGLAITFPNRTNVTFAVTSEFLLDFTSVAIAEAAYRVEARTNGNCSTKVKVWVDGPLAGLRGLRVRRSPLVALPEQHSRRPEAIPGAVVAEELLVSPVMVLTADAPCEPKSALLQVELVLPDGSMLRSRPTVVPSPPDFPSVVGGRLGTSFIGSKHALAGAVFALQRAPMGDEIPQCVENSSCDKTCKRGDIDACLYLAERSLMMGEFTAATKVVSQPCRQKNVLACLVVAIGSARSETMAKETLDPWCQAGLQRACLVTGASSASDEFQSAQDDCRRSGTNCWKAAKLRAMMQGDVSGLNFSDDPMAELRKYNAFSNHRTDTSADHMRQFDAHCFERPGDCVDALVGAWLKQPVKGQEPTSFASVKNTQCGKVDPRSDGGRSAICFVRATEAANQTEPVPELVFGYLRAASLAGYEPAQRMLPEFFAAERGEK